MPTSENTSENTSQSAGGQPSENTTQSARGQPVMASQSHFSLPEYPPFIVTDDPATPSLWEDWVTGLECLFSAMQIHDQRHMYNLLRFYIGNEGRRILMDVEEQGEKKD